MQKIKKYKKSFKKSNDFRNKKKHIEKTKSYINKKRNSKSDIDYAIIKQQHEQASRKLSGVTNHINNRVFKKWNPSAYKYDEKGKNYVLRKEITAGIDVPKRISWKNY